MAALPRRRRPPTRCLSSVSAASFPFDPFSASIIEVTGCGLGELDGFYTRPSSWEEPSSEEALDRAKRGLNTVNELREELKRDVARMDLVLEKIEKFEEKIEELQETQKQLIEEGLDEDQRLTQLRLLSTMKEGLEETEIPADDLAFMRAHLSMVPFIEEVEAWKRAHQEEAAAGESMAWDDDQLAQILSRNPFPVDRPYSFALACWMVAQH